MPENIGKTVKVLQKVEQLADATRFRFDKATFDANSHEIDVQVTFYDAADNQIGGARWFRINPIEGVDKWKDIFLDGKISVAELKALFKLVVQ